MCIPLDSENNYCVWRRWCENAMFALEQWPRRNCHYSIGTASMALELPRWKNRHFPFKDHRLLEEIYIAWIAKDQRIQAFVLNGDGQNIAYFLRDDIKLRNPVPWSSLLRWFNSSNPYFDSWFGLLRVTWNSSPIKIRTITLRWEICGTTFRI